MVHVEKTGDGTEADAGFLMGCERTEGEYTNSNCENNAQFPHIVKLTKDFYIGKYEVTLKQWRHVTGGVPGTAVTEFEGVPNDNLPVTRVSYEDVVKFVDGLNNEGEYATTEYLVSGMKWALPTEAQWEYAARGGNKPTNCPNAPNADKWGCLFSGGSFLPNVAWYGATSGGNSGGTIHPVGTVVPIGADPASATPDTTPANSSNELGLYDMSGNVREWVQDWYAVHTIETRIDYAGPDTGSQRVHRGGSYSDSRPTVTVANRSSRNPTSVGQATLGFRLALVPVGTSTATSTPTAKPTFKPTFFESASGTVSGLWDSVVSGVKSLWNSITK
jgi:formylglycine-generating enzyme required for sulfatase activity